MKHQLSNLRLIESSKNWKNTFFRIGFSVMAFETISGTYLAFKNQMGHYDMFIMLGHLLVGFFIWMSSLMFLKRHLIYRKIWNHLWYDLLGFSIFVLLLASAISGTFLFFYGRVGLDLYWILHLISSYIGILGLFIYLYFTLKFSFEGLKDSLRKPFKKLLTKISTFVLISTCLLGLAALIFGYISEHQWKKTSLKKDLSVPHSSITTTGSKSCGTSGCHVDIYNQWTASTHGNTPNVFVSASMQLLMSEGRDGELIGKTSAEKQKILQVQDSALENLKQCLACHSPGSLLNRKITRPFVAGDLIQDESVSCLYCHSINKVKKLPGLGSTTYELKKFKTYAINDPQSKIGQFLNDSVLYSKPNAHKFNLTKPFYKESEYCIGCHNRLQYTSWIKSPYHTGEQKVKAKTCQNCHMPQVVSHNDISSKIKGTVADHRFISAGLTMAKYYNKKNQFAETKKSLEDHVIITEIIAPRKITYKAPLTFSLFVGNSGVGHMFPSGPEGDLSEAWPSLIIKDQDGAMLFSSGELDERGRIQDDVSKLYRIVPLDKHELWVGTDRHRSWKFAMDLKAVISPRMYDEIKFTIDLSKISRKVKRLFITSSLNYRKPNQEYADWVLGERTFLVPVVVMDKSEAVIDISDIANDTNEAHSQWLIQLKSPQKMTGLIRQVKPYEIEMKVRVKTPTGFVDSY